MRSALARKALMTKEDLKETKEELAVKDLIILDSNKKKKDLEKQLEKYKQLYENVKNERNNYVNLIQVAS